MKHQFGLMAGVVAVALGVTCRVYGDANDSFDSSLTLPSLWNGDSGVLVSNLGQNAHSPNNALYVPVLSTVTNASAATGRVWTDFFTKPVRLSAAAPNVDTNATAQVFVNSNGMWSTLSGNGSGTAVITNTWATTLVPGATYPTVTVASAWHHVSVLHDYSASKWALYVDDIPLATNLGFIANAVAAHEWFQVQNLGGNATNVAWVDDFILTNKLPVVIATNAAPGSTTNGVPLVVAMEYFGTSGDPRPTATNASATGDNVSFAFKTQAAGDYVLIGGPSLSGGMALKSPVMDASGAFTDNSIANTNKYFYKVVRRSEVDPSVTVTNAETYAVYKQTRASSRSYVVGIPVDMIDGDRTMGGALGNQLASGLSANDTLLVYKNGIPLIYTLQGNGKWTPDGDASLTEVLPAGQGAIVRTYSSTSGSTIFAGTVPTNAASSINLATGPNVVTWPYEKLGSLSAFAGFTEITDSTNNSYIYVQNGSDAVSAARKVSGGWKSGTRVGGGVTYNPALQPGAGIFVYQKGNGATWSPAP